MLTERIADMSEKKTPGVARVKAALTEIEKMIASQSNDIKESPWHKDRKPVCAWHQRRVAHSSDLSGRLEFVAKQLGEAACTDKTQKAYAASRIVRGVIESNVLSRFKSESVRKFVAATFLGQLKSCKAVFDRLDGNLVSSLEILAKNADKVKLPAPPLPAEYEDEGAKLCQWESPPRAFYALWDDPKKAAGGPVTQPKINKISAAP